MQSAGKQRIAGILARRVSQRAAGVALALALFVWLGAYVVWRGGGAGGSPGIVAAAALTAGALAVWWRRRPVRGDTRAEAFLAANSVPGALVARDGSLRACNPAGRALGLTGATLEEALGGALEGGDGAVYRLGREALRGGLAEGWAELRGRPFRVTAEALESGLQLWLFRDIPDAGEEAAATPAGDGYLEDLPVALARLTGDGEISFVNAAARKLLGARGVAGAQLGSLLEGLGKPIADRLADTLAGKAQGRSEVARGTGGDVDRFLQVTMSRVEGPEGPSILAVLSDATELKTLEAQFVQSQKMQAVGQLAGGIAHDFNNLLTAINGHCDLLLLRHLQGDADHSDLMQIRQNTNRAASLVRQLLAFSRKQTLRPQVLHLYDTLAELANLLNRLLGARVELRIENAEDVWPIRVDERQLEQVIVNLVVNARDAMPSGGVVNLRTARLELAEPLERDRAVVPPGRYLLLEVEDNGNGIAPDKIGKIFEPFFTTKKVGEGTGLGLSTAYGIIKQMDGFIFVDSTPGEGTRFQIYLPAYEPPAAASAAEDAAEAPQKPFRDLTGQGVILLVEDEAPVRAFAARALQMRGYTVLEADSGEAALELLADPDLNVDLFVSDVVMPGLDGPSWVRRAYESRPAASTVFMSGYSEDMFSDGRAGVPRSSYLPKPFTLNDLTERVREHMDRYAG